MENKFASILETLIGFFIFSPLPYVHLPQFAAHPGKRSFIYLCPLGNPSPLSNTSYSGSERGDYQGIWPGGLIKFSVGVHA